MSSKLASIARVSAAVILGHVTVAAGLAHASVSSASFELSDAQQVAATTASGIQIYSCEFDASHRLGWVFKSPHATLYDASGHQSIRHDAGPSWQAEDGSKIVGHVISQKPSQTPGSIPQLLLEAKSVAGNGTLSEVRYVERLNTVGGSAPSEACMTEHQIGNSPYLARYVFWK